MVAATTSKQQNANAQTQLHLHPAAIQHPLSSVGMPTKGKGIHLDAGHTLGARMMPPLMLTKLLVITAFTGNSSSQYHRYTNSSV